MIYVSSGFKSLIIGANNIWIFQTLPLFIPKHPAGRTFVEAISCSSSDVKSILKTLSPQVNLGALYELLFFKR
jgi:hypothetical protein